MQKIIKPKLIPLIVGVFIFFGETLGAADFETWTFVGGQTKIRNTGFFFHSANFFRNGSGYFLNHTQLALDFPSKKSISFGVGYKQEYVEFPNRWRTEYRPMLHLYYKKNGGNFSFRDRSRWEFRFMDGELINRYRNQLQLSFTKSKKITPYFSTEFSFYFDKFDYTRQRTILGAEIPVKNFVLNLFAGHQLNKDFPNDWNATIMTGTGLVYRF